MKIRFALLFPLLPGTILFGQSWQILQNSEDKLTILVEFEDSVTPHELKEIYFTVGLPTNELPPITIDFIKRISFQRSDLHPFRFEPSRIAVMWESLEKFRNVNVGILKVIPVVYDVDSNLSMVTRVQVSIPFLKSPYLPVTMGKHEESLYRSTVINWSVSRNWLETPPSRKGKKPLFRHRYQPLIPDTLRDSTLQADHVIVSPEEFLSPAEDLATHRTNSGIKSMVASLAAIYNEFNPNDSLETWQAIREFLRYTLIHWEKPAPQFVLLLGDGPDPLPTFPSSSPTGFSSDARYVYLHGSLPEMAIGRLPVGNLTEAENVVEKTVLYESDPETGLWRQRVTLVADDFARPNFDKIELTHTKNSEEISNIIPRMLEVNKLYMEEYPEVNDGSQYGVTKPQATEALFDFLEQGTAILNYIGHGSAYQWAQEGLLSAARGDAASINTGMKLPIWVAATCDWGSFNTPEGNAFSEEILRMRRNGAVAIISSIEAIGFEPNKEFVIDLFKNFFPSNTITSDRLGIVFRTVQRGVDRNERFHLLGDPALKLALSPNAVTVDHVTPDTLESLKKGNYWGHVGEDAPSEGEGFAILYDTEQSVTLSYARDSYREDVHYTLPGRTLFRGRISLINGTFQGSFTVPLDINYSGQNGRLAVYLYSQMTDGIWEGLGVKEGLRFVGAATNTGDNNGPIITFALDDRNLQWGDHINENSELIIKISDPLGINMTGEIGHSIRMWLNEDESNVTDLTHLFVYDQGSYTNGSVVYSLEDVSHGRTVITVEAWDNANNPSQQSVLLNLVSGVRFQLSNVFNFPNPFESSTQFGFEINQEADVGVKIYTIAGRLVKELEPRTVEPGYRHIDWDGLDDFGDPIANGVYLYQIEARSTENRKKIAQIGKAAKYR